MRTSPQFYRTKVEKRLCINRLMPKINRFISKKRYHVVVCFSSIRMILMCKFPLWLKKGLEVVFIAPDFTRGRKLKLKHKKKIIVKQYLSSVIWLAISLRLWFFVKTVNFSNFSKIVYTNCHRLSRFQLN